MSNRLTVIHEHSEPNQWRYVNSEINPADDASRGLTVDTMIQNSRWLSGPEFLTKEEHLWPRDPSHHQMELSTDDPEVKRDAQTYIQTAIRQPTEDVPTKLFHQFSSRDKLRKAFAWLLRFKIWFIQKHRRLSGNSTHSMSQTTRADMSVSEVQVAEREIFRHV